MTRTSLNYHSVKKNHPRITPLERTHNKDMDFFIKSPKHLIKGNIVSLTKSQVLLDFGNKELVSFSRKRYIELLTQLYLMMNTSYLSTTRATLSKDLKTNLKRWLKEKLKLGESIEIKVSSIESMKNMVSINFKESLTYLGKIKLFYELNQIKEQGDLIKGLVLHRIKGGYTIGIGGFTAFLPWREGPRLSKRKKFKNKSISFKISQLNISRKNIVLIKA